MAKNTIIYRDKTYTSILSGNCYLTTSLPYTDLEANTIKAIIESQDSSLLQFHRGEPLVYQYDGRQIGVFYVQDIKRIAKAKYDVYATSAIGLLAEGTHYGGMYIGMTAGQLIADICGTIAHVVKSNLAKIKIYGWLPIASPRDNLAQVLFAIGATIATDLDGVLHIQGLWDGINRTIPKNRMGIHANVEYNAPVTQVSVTEHQYIAFGESEQLYEGRTDSGDVIKFDKPMYDLQATGFTITESNANFVRVSAGSGTLTGKPYTHTTRVVNQAVMPSDEANVKIVDKATLVSYANITDVVDRMKRYYMNTETIHAPVLYKGEKTGDRLLIYHPYDEATTDGCVKSLDINLSNTLMAKTAVRLGYVPTQTADATYRDTMRIIDTDTNWTVPAGVSQVKVVLIGGGGLGGQGQKGGLSPTPKKKTVTASGAFLSGKVGRIVYMSATAGGAGGAGGTAGAGGKVFTTTVAVEPGQKWVIKIGKGTTSECQTTFGAHTSDSGTSMPEGYTEEQTGQVFAVAGIAGIAGGRGSGWNVTETAYGYNKTFVRGNAVNAYGKTYYPGEQKSSSSKTVNPSNYEYDAHVEWSARAYGSAGCGAAAGSDGVDGSTYQYVSVGAANVIKAYCANVSPSMPPKPPQATGYGTGGQGGAGGGGQGGYGGGYTKVQQNKGYNEPQPPDQSDYSKGPFVSYGGAGGLGGGGCAILYYRATIPIASGHLHGANSRRILDKTGRAIVV